MFTTNQLSVSQSVSQSVFASQANTINQSTNQPTYLPTYLPTDWPTDRPTDQSTIHWQSINQSISQSVSQSINQPINQSFASKQAVKSVSLWFSQSVEHWLSFELQSSHYWIRHNKKDNWGCSPLNAFLFCFCLCSLPGSAWLHKPDGYWLFSGSHWISVIHSCRRTSQH